MRRSLLYLPVVASDYAEAFAYYETRPPSAALKLDEAFSRADEDVEDGLVAHQRVFEHYHRGFIGRFPCHRYYRLNHNHAIVAGVVYARFQLQQIEAILRERE